MKIVVVGGTGTIGAAVVQALSERHEVVVATRHTDPSVDIEDPASIEALYDALPGLDAVVCTAGAAAFGKLSELSDEDFALGLRSKLMGQVNLVRLGLSRLNEGGSFTLTSGVLAVRPIPGSGAIALTNAALEGFTRAAALETPGRVRVNVVSPPWISETLRAMGRSPSSGLPAAECARAYVEAVEGTQSGHVLCPE